MLTKSGRAFALISLLALTCAARVGAAESVLYRLFLMDGTTLISYGEFARVADRVVFSIPLGDTAESPALQLVSIPQASVDWERTNVMGGSIAIGHPFGATGARLVTTLANEMKRRGVQFGLITDAKLCPEPQKIIELFEPEFQRLLLVTLMLPWE